MSYADYYVESLWMGGGLSTSDIGARFLSTLRRLEPLDQAMNNWLFLERRKYQYATEQDAISRMTSLVESNVALSDITSGEPDRELGYTVYAKGSRAPTEFGEPDSVNVSADVGGKWRNEVTFDIGCALTAPDLSLVTYPIYRGALEAIATVWPCPWALAFSFTHRDKDPPQPSDRTASLQDVPDFSGHRKPFATAWIAYLSAPLAAKLAPPSQIACERTPGGGMILSAVEERIDESNPEHMRRSAMLRAIMTDRVGVEPGDVPRERELPARTGPF